MLWLLRAFRGHLPADDPSHAEATQVLEGANGRLDEMEASLAGLRKRLEVIRRS